MTREEIIKFAREAGLCTWEVVPDHEAKKLEHFAGNICIMAAAERDAYEQDGNCKHCEDGCPACDARMIEVEQARVDALARSYESGYYAGVNAERERIREEQQQCYVVRGDA